MGPVDRVTVLRVSSVMSTKLERGQDWLGLRQKGKQVSSLCMLDTWVSTKGRLIIKPGALRDKLRRLCVWRLAWEVVL